MLGEMLQVKRDSFIFLMNPADDARACVRVLSSMSAVRSVCVCVCVCSCDAEGLLEHFHSLEAISALMLLWGSCSC